MAKTQEARSKISPLRFRMAAATILGNTALLELVEEVDLRTDGDGNLTNGAVQALKVLFSAAIKAAADDITRGRLQRMSEFLNEY